MPEVTIVLPLYNGASYISEAIKSILSQDFKDFELHILDDRSEDKGPDIVQSVCDSRVRYSRNEERFGLFKTLNRGFKEARTPLVHILAQDDCMVAGSLGKFVAFARKNPKIGMLYSSFLEIDSVGESIEANPEHTRQRERTPEIADGSISALLFFCYGCLPGNISTVMLRREAWENLGGFLTGLQQIPDYDMWVRISEKYPIGFINEKLIKLRNHPLQLSKVGYKQLTIIEEEILVFERLKNNLKNIVSDVEFIGQWMTHRGIQHMHWTMRSLLRGDLYNFTRGWKLIQRYGNPRKQAMLWLFTVNGRLFIPSRHQFFDEKMNSLNYKV